MSEVTEIRKLDIFQRKMAAKPTLEEFESIFMDCVNCPSKAIAVIAAQRLQEIFLDPKFESQELRLAVIESDAFTKLSEHLFELLNEHSAYRYKSKDEMLLTKREREERKAYEDKARQEQEVLEASDTTPERYEPRG